MCFNHLYMNQTHLDQSGGNIGGPLGGINYLILRKKAIEIIIYALK